MSAHSYHIPVNKISSQTRKTEPVTTMVSTTPTSVAIKPMHPLPPTTIAHLESIFEAVKKQVSIWGENARWKIDLVLLPDEETESQNQTIEDIINSNSTVGHHSPVSENATSSSRSIYDSSSMLQLNPKTEDDVLCESNPQSFSMLDDDSVDKLDIEDAKRMLRDVMLHIRAYETMLERSTREFGLKLKEANNRLKKANEHIEGMIKYHTMRVSESSGVPHEKEKSSKHAVEIQLLQEDLRILSRKLKESNAQLIESRAKQASLQQEQEACRESYRVEQRSGQKEKKSSKKK
ncbi:758_t:CDS:2, partial [Cetraspora pellucida]